MIIVPPGGEFLNGGAIILTKKETRAIIHALNNETLQKGEDQSENLSIEEKNKLVDQLNQFANINKGS